MKLAPRSYLFVPGDRPERFGKALASGADAVIVDLEDAVAPDAKDKARDALANWLSAEHPVVVRINAAGTKWFGDDLALCAHPGVAAVMLPKAERTDELEHVARACTVPGGRGNGRSAPVVLLPLIESALGFAHALALAQVAQVERLGFGTIDFQLDLGMDGGDEELLWFRSQLVLASRLAQKLAPIDGVTPAIDDVAAISQDVARARRIGLGAKLCIHPRQVPVVNRGFAPSAEQLAWAQRTVAAALGSDGAAVAVDGAMVDRPVLLRAQAILREAEERGVGFSDGAEP
ncbi:MAG: CoA ester lyase [Burkholderiaceae bacterium]|nr:CoA ester lyase [Burkholderiaceae bacterium]